LSDNDISQIQKFDVAGAKFCHLLIFLKQTLLHVLFTELEYGVWLIAITLHNDEFISCRPNVKNWRVIHDAELMPDL
jgi:hypothetical protein